MARHHRSSVTFLGLSILFLGCLWDYETLLMEKQRFPGAIELISGKFRRHSPAFYKWRIEDRNRKLDESPTDYSLYDDLAVSYEKTGQTDLAIKLMQEKNRRLPYQYKTHANLGTFYIHAGELEKGIAEIDKAIGINPNAHFGREVYQRHLVEYLIQKRDTEGNVKLPLVSSEETHAFTFNEQPVGFAKFLIQKEFPDSFSEDGKLEKKKLEASRALVKPAIKGVLGMMRFGNYDSPILLESLAHLTMFDDNGARHLATRAVLKASYEVNDSEASRSYREMAERTLARQFYDGNQMKLGEVEKQLKAEIAAAENWFATIKADEERWIAEGADVEAEYARVYFQDPSEARSVLTRVRRLVIFAGCLLAGLGICLIVINQQKRRQA